METSSALPTFFAGNLPITGEFPSQRPVTQSFVVFVDLRMNKRSKQYISIYFSSIIYLIYMIALMSRGPTESYGSLTYFTSIT